MLVVIGILLAIPSFFCIGNLCLAYYRNKCNNSNLIKSIEEGTRPESLDNLLFSRPIIVNLLKDIFQPNKDQSFYYTICGEYGTGKTTLIRIAAREIGHGVIYVDIPPNIKDFGEAFGKAINFAFEKHICFTNQLNELIQKLGSTNNESDNLMWMRAMKAFKYAAKVYKVKYNRPAVIIYDNVNRLAFKEPEILDILQDDAKDNANSQTYIAVFVSSKGLVLKRMETRNAWSQAFKPPMEIGDLSKEESIEYLVNRYKIKEDKAEKLYELVGGRIIDLKIMANQSLAGQSFSVIKKSILDETEKKFRNAQIHPKQKYHEVVSKIINFLLEHKELNFKAYTRFFNNDKEADEILEKNVFAYHPEQNIVTFQSQSVESYIKANANDFGIKLIDLTSLMKMMQQPPIKWIL